jgi:hypothetical protein
MKCLALATTIACGVAVAPAGAQNPGFAFGDLILGFQTTGSGSNNYVLANLGQAGTIRDFTGNVTLAVNVGAALTAQFGATWFDRTDLYMGLATVGSADEFNGFFVNGDPDLTLYVGQPRSATGTNAFNPAVANSPGYLLTANAVQAAANGIDSAAIVFETNGTGAVSTISSSVSLIDWNDQNPINGGVQGAAFQNVFAGGVQSPFGSGLFGTIGGRNAEAALDLYRIQGFNNIPGQYGFGQPTGVGTYEGTVVIDSTGAVSVLNVPEPTTATFLGLGAGLMGLIRRRRATNA